MSEIDLKSRFPDLELDSGPPALFWVNGCGLSVFGARDHDEETGTYVKTHCVSFLFLPILALRAYRVVKADQGWYFIGTEPLSIFAKVWNLVIIGGLLIFGGLVGHGLYTSTEGYRASKRLEAADRLAEEGELEAAAVLYRTV